MGVRGEIFKKSSVFKKFHRFLTLYLHFQFFPNLSFFGISLSARSEKLAHSVNIARLAHSDLNPLSPTPLTFSPIIAGSIAMTGVSNQPAAHTRSRL